MNKTWEIALTELRQFVVRNPSIQISQNITVIPGEVRPDFYRLFDKTRSAFISDNFPELLERAGELSRAYKQAGERVKNALALEAIELSSGLNWFLINPLDGLMRQLFEPLFDLLKGRCDVSAFEEISGQVVRDTFKLYFNEGYRRWGTLAFLQEAAPDRLWNVKVEDFIQDPATSGGDLAPGDHIEDVPLPVETQKLIFHQHLYCSFLTPKAIIHSNRLNLYMGIRTDFYETRWTASSRSEKQNWLDMPGIYRLHGESKLWPDMAVYLNEDGPQDLALVADYYNVAQPDLIIEFMENADWQATNRLEQIKRHYNVLNPRLGTFVVCREAPPQNVLSAIEEKIPEAAESDENNPADIHILNIGYDPAGFEAVFTAISNLKAGRQPA